MGAIFISFLVLGLVVGGLFYIDMSRSLRTRRRRIESLTAETDRIAQLAMGLITRDSRRPTTGT